MKKFLLLLFVMSLSTTFVFAEDLVLSQFPDNPREGEEVKISITSDKYNLNAAKITWSVDGKEVDSGVGRKTLNVRTSTSGASLIILANVEQEGFNSAQVQKVLEANTNFILYEGEDSYVPSFYKGRRLPSKEGTVLAALFSFKDGSISGFDQRGSDKYIWKINGQEKKDLSGDNRILNHIQSKVTDNSLKIDILKQTGDQVLKTTGVNVPLQRTEVLVYKTDENKLLKQVLADTEVGKKIFLLVEPFFFSVNSKMDKKLTYRWKINDIEANTETPWSVFFSGKERDSVKINLDIINNQKITQENSRGFTFKIE
jgi:hypothetical protein